MKIIEKYDYGNLTYEKICLKNSKEKYSSYDLMKYLVEEIYKIINNFNVEQSCLLNKLIYVLVDVYYFSFKNGFSLNNSLSNEIKDLPGMLEVVELNLESDVSCYLNKVILEIEKISSYDLEINTYIDELSLKITELNSELKDKLSFFKCEIRNYIRENSDILKVEKEPAEIVKKNFANVFCDYEHRVDLILEDVAGLKQKICDKSELSKGFIDRFDGVIQKKVDSLSKMFKNFQLDIEKIIEKELSLSVVDDSQIEREIINKLFGDSLSIDELLKYLKRKGYEIELDDLRKILLNIKQRINITRDDVIYFPQMYQVCKPRFEEYNEMIIDVGENKSMDFLLVSDMHLSKIDTKTLEDLEKMYDYAVEKNIKLILNLGDFVFCVSDHLVRSKSYDDYVMAMRTCDDIASFFPYDKNIFHAVMGGNHDEDIMSFGFDPLKRICMQRSDFLLLGYNHATVRFCAGNENDSKIMLHHPKQRVPNALLENCYDVDLLKKMLKGYYDNQGLNKDDYYMDFLGHFHKASFDMMNNYCVVPSYFKDRLKNGALHLKVYFDKNKKINYLVVLPLVIENKLTPVNELVFKKSR